MTIKRIACLGDSNTYGFDPLGTPEKRYPPDSRWPDILARETGWTVFNLSENGRKIPVPTAERRDDLTIADALSKIEETLPLDLLVIMLGSNNIESCLKKAYIKEAWTGQNAVSETSGRICQRMRCFMKELKARFPKLPTLLISPPKLFLLAEYQDVVDKLQPLYRNAAEKYGMFFASAYAWDIPLSTDGVHFSAEGHSLFAEKLQKEIKATESGNHAVIAGEA